MPGDLLLEPVEGRLGVLVGDNRRGGIGGGGCTTRGRTFLRFDCGETVGEISGERLFSWGQKVDCQY